MVGYNTSDMRDSIVYCDCREVIFAEKNLGDEMYVIHSGKVEISRMTDRGKQILCVLGKGSFFGEMALLSDTPRTATAIAIEPTTLLPFTKEAMIERIENNPTFALSLIIALSERLMNTTSSLMEQIETMKRSEMAYAQASLDGK